MTNAQHYSQATGTRSEESGGGDSLAIFGRSCTKMDQTIKLKETIGVDETAAITELKEDADQERTILMNQKPSMLHNWTKSSSKEVEHEGH